MVPYGRQGLGTSPSPRCSDPGLLRPSPALHLRLLPFRSQTQRTGAVRTAAKAGRSSRTHKLDEGSNALQSKLQGLEETLQQPRIAVEELASTLAGDDMDLSASARRRRAAKARHQLTYKFAAIGASLGVTALAICAVHYRFAWHMQNGGDVPWAEAVLTILLTFGGVVGMEMWARWAHKALWHDFAPGWTLHKSHHAPRLGPFEANDVFAVVNAVPAIGLCAYGFLTPTILGGVCFGAGLGITLFGMMYMFVHDGLVHKRFPVGPLADVPYLKRVAAAHKLHHAERFNGVPWGLFLGPMELEAVGGKKDLDYLCRELEVAKKR